MMDKIINILETIGAFMIIGAFYFNNVNYIVSDILFWGAFLLFLPGIIKRHIFMSFLTQCLIGLVLIVYIAIGIIFFTKQTVEIKLPALPKITMVRG